MPCDDCKMLEKRIEQLRMENLEIQERRSRERTRFLNLEQKMFLKNLDQPSSALLGQDDVLDILDLLERVIEDPTSERLENIKSQLQKYIVYNSGNYHIL